MKKMIRASILGAAAVLTVAAVGCGKKSADTETAAESTTAAASEAEEEEQNFTYGDTTSVTLGDYKAVPVTVTKAIVTDQELDDQINQILSANPNYVQADRAAQDGDKVNIDFTGKLEGETEPFDGGTAQGYDLELGSGSFIEGFEDQVVGMKAGETKDIEVTFPEDYKESTLAGKPAVFTVTLNTVSEKQDAVLDDAFVQRVAPEAGTVDGYRSQIREKLLSQKQTTYNNQRNSAILETIAANSTIVLGKDEVDNAFYQQLISANSTAQSYGLDMNTYLSYMGMSKDTFSKQLRSAAEKTVEGQALIKAIADAEGMSADDNDRLAYAQLYGYDSVDAMKAASSNITDESIEEGALQKKVMDFLVANAQITEVEETTAAETEAAAEETAGTEAEEESAEQETAAN